MDYRRLLIVQAAGSENRRMAEAAEEYGVSRPHVSHLIVCIVERDWQVSRRTWQEGIFGTRAKKLEKRCWENFAYE